MDYNRPTLTVANKKIACSPLVTSVQKQGSNFITIKQKTNLISSQVVVGNGEFRTGSYIYIRGDVITLPWAKEVYTLGGKSFILVPEEFVLMNSDTDLMPKEG